jgi:hypothetical protein
MVYRAYHIGLHQCGKYWQVYVLLKLVGQLHVYHMIRRTVFHLVLIDMTDRFLLGPSIITFTSLLQIS